MLKQAVNALLNQFGYTVARHVPHQKSRRSTELELVDTATGRYYLPRDAHQDAIAIAIKENRIFDEEIYNASRSCVTPGTVVLDVGSNFGQMALLLSRLTGPEGQVHAFDADDFVYAILEKNVAVNQADNVVTHFGAVHDVAGQTLYFPVQDFERFGTYVSFGIDYKNQQGRPVPTLTIDDLDISRPVSFMKVDVQGGDLLALRGARRTIDRHRMPIIFEYEYLFEDELGLKFQEYVDFVQSIGYRFDKVLKGNNFLIRSIT